MVFQKTIDYGLFGFKVPRATRSFKRRGPFKKETDDNPMCAFDLLATVAGNILEKECSPNTSNAPVKNEPLSVNKSLKLEDPLVGNLEKVSFVSDTLSRAPISLKDFLHVHNDDLQGVASVVTSSDCSEKIEDINCAKNRIKLGNFANNAKKTCDYVLDDETKEQMKLEAPKTEIGAISTIGDIYSSDIMLESNVKLSLSNGHVTSDNLHVGSRDDVKLVSRDDDENSFRCSKFGTGTKAFRPSPRVGDRRIRKLLASKYWKVATKSKESTNYKPDLEMKPAYQDRNNCHKRHRSQRDYPLKKRRLYRCSSAFNSDGGDDVDSLPRKEFSFDTNDSGAKVNGGSGISARVVGQTTPLQTRDSNVKLRIKSFKVPELLIEVPENATIGDLKRTVLEAVTAVLGGGLRVGVLLQGKKIRDDNRTLQQTGISHDDMLESLGFSLEPNSSQAPSALQHEDVPSLLSYETPQQLKRFPSSPTGVCSAVQPKTIDVFTVPPPLSLGSFVESDHDSAPSPDLSPVKNQVDSRALVPAAASNAEALKMVPFKNSKRSDAAQRRIRRPFSVTEVEALVQAVEKLGTGRWRDVKLRAFDNAKHRTYVDLKDKWKTLVHTARISPQQRRGEPVPQELLDRVLTAHAYWSQQQVKQQLKHHSETRLLL